MSSYLISTRDYFYNRRRRFAVIGGVVGGIYLVGKYAADKVREVQERIGRERRDKENLRRRFAQNQEDCTFTVLALLPTLGDQLFKAMDVEGLTSKLQQSSKPKEVEAPAVETKESENTIRQETSDVNAADGGGQMEESGVLVDKPDENSASTSALESEVKGDSNSAEDVENLKLATEPAQIPQLNGDAQAEVTKSSEAEASTEGYSLPDQTKSELLPQAEQSSSIDTTEQKVSEIPESQETSVQEVEEESKEEEIKTEEASDSRPTPELTITESADANPTLEAISSNPESNVSEVQPKSNGIFEPLPQPISAGASLPHTPPSDNQINEASHSTDPDQSNANPPVKSEESKPLPPSTPSAADVLAEKRAKLALWNELKIVAFSRTLTSLYCIVLLTLQTHIQLNLIGRFAYVSSVSSLASENQMDLEDDESGINLEREKHFIRLENRAEDEDFITEEEEELKRKQRQNERDVKLGLSLSHENERIYLSFSWWFLHKGWEMVESRVREAVQEVVGSIPLKSQLSHADFLKILSQIRKRVEFEPRQPKPAKASGSNLLRASSSREGAQSDTGAESEGGVTSASEGGRSGRRRGKRSNFLSALFPTTPTSELEVLIQSGVLPPSSTLATSPLTKDPQLRALLDETSDIVESPDFLSVLSLSLDRVFSVFDATMRPSFGVQPVHPSPINNRSLDENAIPSPPPRFMELMDGVDDERFGKKVRLAALFPAVARQSQLALHGNPNEYVECLAEVKELRALSAVIFSAWST